MSSGKLKAWGVALAGLAVLGAAPKPPPISLQALLAATPPAHLSDYGIYQAGPNASPNPDLIPYQLNTPLFTDYAEKARYIYLPPGTAMAYRATGVLEFPVGAALIKTFAYPAGLNRPGEALRRIETRLLIRHADGWVANTYVWNADGTDADLKRAGLGLELSVGSDGGWSVAIAYRVPNVNQCKECHARDGEVTPIGPKARNLNGPALGGASRGGRDAENQLSLWSQSGWLTGAPALHDVPRLPKWDDPREAIAPRARAYLDVNCAHCHNRQGFASNSGLFLTYEEDNLAALGVGKRPIAAGRGSGGLEVAIAPGDPDHSILAYRMASTEPGVMMPQLGRSLVHREGLELVRAYIADLKPGPKSP